MPASGRCRSGSRRRLSARERHASDAPGCRLLNHFRKGARDRLYFEIKGLDGMEFIHAADYDPPGPVWAPLRDWAMLARNSTTGSPGAITTARLADGRAEMGWLVLLVGSKSSGIVLDDLHPKKTR